MELAFALRQVGGFAMKICCLDLGSGEISLNQVVFSQQISILQAQAFFKTAGVCIGLNTDWGSSLVVDQIPERQTITERHMELPTRLTDIGDTKRKNGNAA